MLDHKIQAGSQPQEILHEVKRFNKWMSNGWLKHALGYAQIHRDGVCHSLEDYYNDCMFDLQSAIQSSYKVEWIPELQEAVNELSLVFTYGIMPPKKP